jgi:hypothetical protein
MLRQWLCITAGFTAVHYLTLDMNRHTVHTLQIHTAGMCHPVFQNRHTVHTLQIHTAGMCHPVFQNRHTVHTLQSHTAGMWHPVFQNLQVGDWFSETEEYLYYYYYYEREIKSTEVILCICTVRPCGIADGYRRSAERNWIPPSELIRPMWCRQYMHSKTSYPVT